MDRGIVAIQRRGKHSVAAAIGPEHRLDEARVRGASELAASSLDAQFASLEDLGESTEIEARLAAMKSESNVLDQAPTAAQIEEAPAESEIEARLAALKGKE